MLRTLLEKLHLVQGQVEGARVDLDEVKREHDKSMDRLEREQKENERAIKALDDEIAVFRQKRS